MRRRGSMAAMIIVFVLVIAILATAQWLLGG